MNMSDTVRHNDTYAKVLVQQREGTPCPFCGSPWGHYAVCPLINGDGKAEETL